MLALIALPVFCEALLGRDLKAKLRTMNLPPKETDGSDLQPPVVATPYLPGDYAEGQAATKVVLEGWDGPAQFSGFFNFTAERTDGSAPIANTFFWYLLKSLPCSDR